MESSPESTSTPKTDRKKSFSIRKAALGLPLVLAWALLLITSFHSLDFRALSPAGLLIVLITVALVAVYAFKRFRSVRKAHLGLAGLVLLQVTPVPYPSAYDVPVTYEVPLWDIIADNFIMFANTDAWQASFEIYPAQGIIGITPFFYRVALPNYPVTLVMNAAPNNTVQPVGIISGPHRLYLDNSPAILNTLPAHSLLVNDWVLTVPPGLPGPYDDPQFIVDSLLPSLRGACSANCFQDITLEINPEYAALLAIDVLKATTTVIKLPYIAEKTLDIVDMAADVLLSPEWNMRETILSHGTTYMAASEFEWFSHTERVYAGSIFGGSWSLSESSRTLISQQYGVDPPSISGSNPLGRIEVPVLDLPRNPVGLPVFDGPEVPVYGAPVIDLPEVPVYEAPVIDLPEVPIYEAPVIDLPQVPVYEIPEVPVVPIEIPSYEIPEVPVVPIEIPSYEIPEIPVVPIEIPEFNPPSTFP